MEPRVTKGPFWTTTVTQSGQPRAYADSYWVGSVTFHNEQLSTEENARAAAEGVVREGHIYPKDAPKPFHCPWFNSLIRSSADPMTWTFSVQRLFLD